MMSIPSKNTQIAPANAFLPLLLAQQKCNSHLCPQTSCTDAWTAVATQKIVVDASATPAQATSEGMVMAVAATPAQAMSEGVVMAKVGLVAAPDCAELLPGARHARLQIRRSEHRMQQHSPVTCAMSGAMSALERPLQLPALKKC